MTVVEVEHPESGIAVVTLNRPAVLNAINLDLLAELYAVLEQISHDSNCRAVILTGSGGAFCSGADLAGTTTESTAPGDEGRGLLARIWGMQEYVTGIAVAINALRQPVIAAIDGPAVGGGFGFALACDLRVASDRARMGAVFANIGLSNLDVGVSYFLPRLIGAGKALELMLTARIIDAQVALDLGLLADVVPADTLMDRALELAREVTRNSEFAVWMTKRGFWDNVDATSLGHAVQTEYRTQMLGVYHDDMSEAIAAFNSKRKPLWKKI